MAKKPTSPTETPSEDRQIILALFAPDAGHKDGCLFKADHRMPCQCGFSTTVGHYRWALRRAKEIATAHYGSAYEAQGPSEEDEPVRCESAPADDPAELHARATSVAGRGC